MHTAATDGDDEEESVLRGSTAWPLALLVAVPLLALEVPPLEVEGDEEGFERRAAM